MLAFKRCVKTKHSITTTRKLFASGQLKHSFQAYDNLNKTEDAMVDFEEICRHFTSIKTLILVLLLASLATENQASEMLTLDRLISFR